MGAAREGPKNVTRWRKLQIMADMPSSVYNTLYTVCGRLHEYSRILLCIYNVQYYICMYVYILYKGTAGIFTKVPPVSLQRYRRYLFVWKQVDVLSSLHL